MLSKIHVRRFLGFVLSLLVASQAWSQQRVTSSVATPTQTLQEAIDVANPGDTLHADRYGPPVKKYIRVDRPLTLVGGVYYQIEFIGPGYGRSALIGAEVLSDPDLDPNLPGPAFSHPGVSVTGFDLLVIASSVINASGGAGYFQPSGAPGVEAAIFSDLLLMGSSFHATRGGAVPDFTCYAYNGGSPAVSALGTVVAMNCTFHAGGVIGNWWDYEVCPDGPLYTASGGPCVSARDLLHRDCGFVGSSGAFWWNHPEVGGPGPAFTAWTNAREILAGVQVR